ncbi:helix-turn-helix domain-containing protein, partial [Geobacillus thermoleovorans]
MDMTLTAKIKIYPTAEQAEVLKATLSAYRQACNAVSVVIFDTKVLVQAKLHDMTYRLLRSNYALR